MKSILNLSLSLILLGALSLSAEEKHNHKATAGPNGGKILEIEPLHAEFLVQADKKVRITYYDAAMKPLPVSTQEVKVIAEAKTGKAVLDFEKSGEVLISKTALPEGSGYRVVLQLKADANAKPQNFRIDYNAEICGGCKLVEYACTCDHAGSGGGHGH